MKKKKKKNSKEKRYLVPSRDLARVPPAAGDARLEISARELSGGHDFFYPLPPPIDRGGARHRDRAASNRMRNQ